MTLDLFVMPALRRTAVISGCGQYRYLLTEPGDPRLPPILWTMFNPSKADAKRDDPTLKRVLHFSRAWGFGDVLVGNLYGYRDPHPEALLRVTDPVGPESDRHLSTAAAMVTGRGGRLVVAWGKAPLASARIASVGGLLRQHGAVWCVVKNPDGSPRHPLARGKMRIPNDATAQLFAGRTE